MTSNLLFITLMGVVSLFSDMTHEGARSILGPFLSLTGASATVVAVISGAGELCGYSLRLLSGFVADKTHKYWTLVILGYALQVASVPALALVGSGGWAAACTLVILERVMKAIKKPAKNTLVSFAASGIGVGKGFAYQEMLDQLGAFAGPVMLFLLSKIKSGDMTTGENVASTLSTYRLCFAALLFPAIITIVFTLIAHSIFPHPETFEEDVALPSAETSAPNGNRKEHQDDKNIRLPPIFAIYMIGISLFAFGFADFPLLSLHASRTGLFSLSNITLLYALAMLSDALSALFFGTLFDHIGSLSLAFSTFVAAAFAPLVFISSTSATIIAGVALWGVGMGAQESVMKAYVASVMPKSMRSTGFGVAETGFGVAWFLGSAVMGVLYDKSRLALCIMSATALIASGICALLLHHSTIPCARALL